MTTLPTWADVERAERLIGATLPPTPLIGDEGLMLKLESLQPTGSFKVRGALAGLDAIDPQLRAVTASAGNHGLGLTWAAQRLGRQATVVTATSASPIKIDALRTLGADLIQFGATYDDAERHAIGLAGPGSRYLSPYNDPSVIAGQATIGCELATQHPGPLTVVCAAGGGGLAAGLGLWAAQHPGVRVVGVESAVSRAVSSAVAAGRQVDVEVGDTIADGISGNIEPGSVTIGLVARYVDRIVAVSEEQLRAAIRHLALDRGVVAEGAGAVAVAAVLAGLVPDDRPVVAVVSGRNINPATLAAILQG
ncbi:pyridoxal-phosphate dependent enzyme [Actinoplanes sp. NBRC 103695]|uniref:threonine ammonia-lyase n=1 Tax=Actinoplanes sp. NBRC 103695 TaxID=3032202 RepID=UPI002552AB50|nr:pyridoxal-phosphate dependent enzyme [Actinoplanes sp. NBRC 103695]